MNLLAMEKTKLTIAEIEFLHDVMCKLQRIKPRIFKEYEEMHNVNYYSIEDKFLRFYDGV